MLLKRDICGRCRPLTWGFVENHGTYTKVRKSALAQVKWHLLNHGCFAALYDVNLTEWADYLVQEAYYQREQEAQVGLTETQNPLKWETQAKGQNWFLTNMCCPMFEAIQRIVVGFEPWVRTSRSIQTRWSELEQQAAAAAGPAGA